VRQVRAAIAILVVVALFVMDTWLRRAGQ
jgi:hypothetical protein